MPRKVLLSIMLIRFYFVDDADKVLRVIKNECIPERDSSIPNGQLLGLGFVGMEWQRL